VLAWTVILLFSEPGKVDALFLMVPAAEAALYFLGTFLLGLSSLRSKRTTTLLLCCSGFCIGCAILTSGVVLSVRGIGAEARLALHMGMVVAAILTILSGLAALDRKPSAHPGRGAAGLLVFLTSGAALLFAAAGRALVTGPASAVLMPLSPFLGLGALLLFCLSSALLLVGYKRNGADIFYWSALALVVVAVSMGVGILDGSGRGLVFWIGRAAETIGAAYFVIAAVGSLRSVSSTIAERTTLDREKSAAGPKSEPLRTPEDEPLEPDFEHGSREERLLHAVIDSIPEGILVVDRTGRIVLSNPAAQGILGRPLEAGQDITTRDTPGDMLNLPLVCSILEEKEQRNLRMTVTWPDGRQRNLILNSAPLRDLRGELMGAVAVYHDCSRWKGEETADRFRSIVEALPDAVAVFDTDRRLLYANEPFRAGAGLKGPIEGLELREAELYPPYRTFLMEGLDTVLDSCIDHYAPFEEPASEGVVPCRFRFIPDFDETGRIAEILVIGRQTTWSTRRETVQEMERTGPEPLTGEQDLGTKNAFMANMSHELRTPLSGILGLSELTLDSELPDRVRKNVEMIHGSAQELACIVDNVLDFSRLETDQLQLDLVDFDLKEMMEPLVRGFKDKAEAKGLELTLEMRGDLPRIIFADPYRIGQVLKNLIGNAVKFTERGHVRVTVGKEGEDGDSLFLVFVVMDTGIGIPHQFRHNVFNEFQQLDSGYGKQHAGIGLGLALCRRLAERMGGSIDFQSTEGKGSTFVFRTRMRRREFHAPENDRIKADSILALLPEMSILLAEDNRVNQLFLSKLLTRAGHAPEIAGNGLEALRALERTRFDLVLMDIQMPVMDGVEATRAIRNGQGAIDRTVPIIGLTAFAMPGDRERFMAAGMDGYVPKPVNLEELALEIRRVIRKKGRGSLLPHEQRM
jgi:PAS domain S-box-containing protein